MEKIGIICEYNPFHNGHLYHIEKIREMYPNSILILVMSGYFTQRGDLSFISKYNKTKIALKYGIDLVLELPVLYTTNSADYFAEVSLAILNETSVQKLVFGSECNNIKKLKHAAEIQLNNNEVDTLIKKELDKGINYPSALAKVCNDNFDSNDLLGISYIKTIIKNGYNIEPITIKRTNDFNDLDNNDKVISARNIRKKIRNNQNINGFIPEYEISFINKIDEAKMFELLKYKIISTDELENYLGVDEGLHNKLKKEIYSATSIDDLIERIKSKRYTYVRLKRMLVHVLLGIKKEDMNIQNEYFHILGFSSKGQEYLKKLKSKKLVYKYDNRVRELEIRASYIYYLITKDKSCKIELQNRPIK